VVSLSILSEGRMAGKVALSTKVTHRKSTKLLFLISIYIMMKTYTFIYGTLTYVWLHEGFIAPNHQHQTDYAKSSIAGRLALDASRRVRRTDCPNIQKDLTCSA
jgi:hypothetical protein